MHRISLILRDKRKSRSSGHLHNSSSSIRSIVYRILRSDLFPQRPCHNTAPPADIILSIYNGLRRALTAIRHRTNPYLCIRQYGLYSFFYGIPRSKTSHASLERVNRHKYFIHNNSCLYTEAPVILLCTWLKLHIAFVYYNTICNFCTQKVGRIQNCCYVLYTPRCSKGCY